MKKNKEISPLEELRREKEILKGECTEKEGHLSEYWTFISDNLNYLILDSIVGTFKQKLGLSPSKKTTPKANGDETEKTSFDSTGFMHTIKTGLQMTYPFLWEIAQPFVWEFVMKKIKSLFGFGPKKKRKKKAKQYIDDDGD